ncbi:ATP-binding protein [Streptomyces axinellae]|uniref:ATP-binding protein n=1 Tax=Streptomyces axinellae TaxID=552788 RepID=UPI003CD07F76
MSATRHPGPPGRPSRPGLTCRSSDTGHPAYSETLPREPESARAARALVRTALAAWGLDELADDGGVVVSELVTNAVRHTRCHALRVTVARTGPGTVRIGVVDRSTVRPVLRAAGPEDTRGRGLALVAALTRRWGTDQLPWGKRVWGELRREGGPGAHRAKASSDSC